MRLSVELAIIKLKTRDMPTIKLVWEDLEGADCIAEFDPDKLLLAESTEPGYYSLVDGDGFKHIRIRRDDRWTEAASKAGFFCLTMKAPLPNELIGGRILVVAFPFGEILQDSSTFSIHESDIDKLESMELLNHKLRDSAEALTDSLAQRTVAVN